MKKELIKIFDTSLRDGQQTFGVNFTLEDKVKVVGMLDKIGFDYIEGGYPGANPIDTQLFSSHLTANAKFCAFSMVKRVGRPIDADIALQEVLNCKADTICFVAKASKKHVLEFLGFDLDSYLISVCETIRAALSLGKRVVVDCEHYFDGYIENKDYALSVVQQCYKNGAEAVVLCDTNGGTLPHQIFNIVEATKFSFPEVVLGIHTHDDTGHAVANTFAALDAGARHIQGTINGIGERCGNANLLTIIPTLLLKPYYADRFELSFGKDRLKDITNLSKSFDEVLNRPHISTLPYVGTFAFATKAGIHASAMVRDVGSYEHLDPSLVGNERLIGMSDQSGKSNLLSSLKKFGLELSADDPRILKMLTIIKQKERDGYAYDTAPASFELLCRQILGKTPVFFKVLKYGVRSERSADAEDSRNLTVEAVVKILIGNKVYMSVAESDNGPVNALDLALRKDLGELAAYIGDMFLADYRVRVLNGGTSATTRVLIDSGDSSGSTWSTVGVSSNIIEASFQALTDALNYRLIYSGASLDIVNASLSQSNETNDLSVL